MISLKTTSPWSFLSPSLKDLPSRWPWEFFNTTKGINVYDTFADVYYRPQRIFDPDDYMHSLSFVNGIHVYDILIEVYSLLLQRICNPGYYPYFLSLLKLINVHDNRVEVSTSLLLRICGLIIPGVSSKIYPQHPKLRNHLPPYTLWLVYWNSVREFVINLSFCINKYSMELSWFGAIWNANERKSYFIASMDAADSSLLFLLSFLVMYENR